MVSFACAALAPYLPGENRAALFSPPANTYQKKQRTPRRDWFFSLIFSLRHFCAQSPELYHVEAPRHVKRRGTTVQCHYWQCLADRESRQSNKRRRTNTDNLDIKPCTDIGPPKIPSTGMGRRHYIAGQNFFVRIKLKHTSTEVVPLDCRYVD